MAGPGVFWQGGGQGLQPWPLPGQQTSLQDPMPRAQDPQIQLSTPFPEDRTDSLTDHFWSKSQQGCPRS